MTCPCGKRKMPGAVWCYKCDRFLHKTKKGRRLYRLATRNGTALHLRHEARRGADRMLNRNTA